MGNDSYKHRKAIEGRLGYRLYDCVWNRAVKDYGFEDEPERLQELQEAADDLQRFAEELKKELEARATIKHRRSTDRVRYLDESERDVQSVLLAESFYIDSDSRAALRALSAYAALKADKDPRVTEFRSRALGMGYLSTEEATRLLYSPAARFLTLDQLQDFDVPLSGHKASLLEPYCEVNRESYFDHRVQLRVEPPGASVMLRYTNLVGNTVDEDEGGLVRCKADGSGPIAPYKISLPPLEVPGTGNREADRGSKPIVGPMLLSNFDTADRPANVWPGSLVDEIYDLAQDLSESFMWPSRNTTGWMGTWWNVDSAALFVLTGVAPLVHPVKVGLARAGDEPDIPSRIVLEVLPWLVPESIVESYKSARRALNVNLRNQGERKFDVVTFVLQRSKSYDPDALDFGRLRESWNAAFPERKFRNTDSFSTYFKRGLRAVEQRYYL